MRKLLIIFIILTLLFLAGSCTTTSRRNRGSLSDAMDRARDDYEREREIPPEKDDPPYYNQDKKDRNNKERDKDNGGEGYDEPTYPPGEPLELVYLVRGGRGLIDGPYFNSGFDGEFLLGINENRTELYALAGLKTLTTRSDHGVSESIDVGSLMVHAGIEGRFYPLPSLSFFSPYFLARAGGFYYFWTFKNPLVSGSDIISSDAVGGAFLGAGAGLDFLHTDYFRLGAQVIPEVYLFGEETSQGFSNDYFSAQATVKWSIEGGFQF